MVRKTAILILLVLVAAGVWWIVRLAGTGGGTALERWCGRQLVRIANDYLRPEFTFDELVYRPPATVTLRNVTITDGDVTFISASSMQVTFSELPQRGEPVIIQSVAMVDPVVRLAYREDGSLIGFTDFIDRTEGEVYDDGGSSRASDVFAIRKVTIENGVFALEPVGQPAMRLDEINVDLDCSPEDAAGVYAIDARLQRAPVLDLEIDGDLDINAIVLALDPSMLRIELGEDQYASLPSGVQQFVHDHQMRGRVELATTGRLPFTQLEESNLDLQGTLKDSLAVFGEYQLPVESLAVTGSLSEQTWSLKPITIEALGGSLDGAITFGPPPERPTSFDVKIDGMRVENALHGWSSDAPPKYAGRVVLNGAVQTNLDRFIEALDGEGDIEVTEGRFANMRLTDVLFGAASLDHGASGNDRAKAHLVLDPECLAFRPFEVVGGPSLARGEGELFFDSRIDFRFNAGPLERVQGVLGPVGEVLGGVTDALMKYQVTGTLDEPKTAVKPLGIGTK